MKHSFVPDGTWTMASVLLATSTEKLDIELTSSLQTCTPQWNRKPASEGIRYVNIAEGDAKDFGTKRLMRGSLKIHYTVSCVAYKPRVHEHERAAGMLMMLANTLINVLGS